MTKPYLNKIKGKVLETLMKYGKFGFVTIIEIRDRIKEDEDFIWDTRIRDELADNYGILTHITSVINQLRREGFPIISANRRAFEKGKGYTFAGEINRKDLDKIWDDKFNANAGIRQNIVNQEKETDEILFRKVYKNVLKAVFAEKINDEMRKKLVMVAQKHNIDLNKKDKTKEEEENDES